MSTTETDTVELGAEGRPSHSHSYPALDKWFTETPWAVRREMLATLREIRQVRLSGHRFSDEEIEARVGARSSSRSPRRTGAIALIPLYGVIIPKATAMTQISGGMTLQDFRGMLRAAVDDPDVAAIMLDVDSPGGSVDQVPETAAEVRAAAQRKPTWAIANTDAYSAAYWIASQASALWVTPSGGVGSVGVYAAHEDWSVFDEKMGVATTLISYGEHKTDGNPYQPLSDEAREKIQRDVDAYGAMFVADVAKGRKTKAATVRSDFGQGATVMARDAVAAGMADKVGTLEQAIRELARVDASGGSTRAEQDYEITAVAVEDAVDTHLAAEAAEEPDEPDPEDEETAVAAPLASEVIAAFGKESA